MKVLWILVLVAFGWGMTSRLIVGWVYMGMRKAVGQNNNKNTLIKQIRLKYDNCVKLDIEVHNVNAFVEKLIVNYKICGLSLNGWDNMSKIMTYLCLIFGIVNGILYNDSFQMVTFGVGMAVLSVLGIKIITEVVDVENQKRILIVSMVDYLENSSAHRNVMKDEMLQKNKLSRSAFNEFHKLSKSYEKIEAVRGVESGKRRLDESVLNEILEEYLT